MADEEKVSYGKNHMLVPPYVPVGDLTEGLKKMEYIGKGLT